MKGATNWKDQLAQLIFSRLYCVATANYISPSWATNYELQAFSHWTYEVVTSIYTADNYYFQLKFPQMNSLVVNLQGTNNSDNCSLTDSETYCKTNHLSSWV